MNGTAEAVTYAVAAAVFARGGTVYQVDTVVQQLAGYTNPPASPYDAAMRLDAALSSAGLPAAAPR